MACLLPFLNYNPPKMKRYDKYKESGISWIGELPEHWEVKRLKSRLSIVKDRGTNSIKVGLENIESFTGNVVVIAISDLCRISF